jgi:hypothetical protein
MVGFWARGRRGADASAFNPWDGAECELTIREELLS